jgi:hypothetical protein
MNMVIRQTKMKSTTPSDGCWISDIAGIVLRVERMRSDGRAKWGGRDSGKDAPYMAGVL